MRIGIDYKPAFYLYGVLLISTRHCVHPITLLANVGYPHTSKNFIIYTHTVKYLRYFFLFKNI